jgi:hypothetical protein
MRATEPDDVVNFAPCAGFVGHEPLKTVLCVLAHLTPNLRDIEMR